MSRPSPQQLFAEAARIAQMLHWPLDDILDLEHADRRRFLTEADHLEYHQLQLQRQLYDEYVAGPQ